MADTSVPLRHVLRSLATTRSPKCGGNLWYAPPVWYALTRGGYRHERPVPKVGATVTDFVGRETELLHLAKLFSNARLVTVIGPGGVGKTSVSLRAAADATDCYADGVWIVELSGLRDPE